MVVLTEAPPCDMDEAHVATVHCPSCDEYFCAGCDALVHARKKCKDHIRDAIEIVEPTVPCDSNPEHVAVMYCEDCEENFCGDCDYAFHSRKKTANHARFEGARRPEDIEALKKEAEAEALAQQLAQQRIAQQQQQQQSKAGASYAAAAATGAKGGVNTSASPPKPATGAAGKTLTTASAAAKPAAAAAAASAAAAAAVSSTPSSPAADGEEEHKSAEERAAEYKAQWDARRKALCKEKYNGQQRHFSLSVIHFFACPSRDAGAVRLCSLWLTVLLSLFCVYSGSLVGFDDRRAQGFVRSVVSRIVVQPRTIKCQGQSYGSGVECAELLDDLWRCGDLSRCRRQCTQGQTDGDDLQSDGR
jgi:hypothetical protein